MAVSLPEGCALQPSLALLVGPGISVTKVAVAK